MQSEQTMGIDLPQKILAWEDDQGKTWLMFNDPSYLAARHNIVDCGPLIEKTGGVLLDIAFEASR